MRGMQSNLVSSPGFQRQLQQRGRRIVFQRAIMRNRLLAVLTHRPAIRTIRMRAERRINSSLRRRYLAVYQGPVDSLQPFLFHLLLQQELAVSIFGKDDAPGSVPIKAVQRPNGAEHLPPLQFIRQIVRQGAVHRPPRRMHQETSRLIQHKHILIFIKNLHAAFFRLYAVGNIIRQQHAQTIAGFYFFLQKYSFAVQQNSLLPRQLLEPSPGVLQNLF